MIARRAVGMSTVSDHRSAMGRRFTDWAAGDAQHFPAECAAAITRASTIIVDEFLGILPIVSDEPRASSAPSQPTEREQRDADDRLVM